MAKKTIFTIDDLIRMGVKFKYREPTEQDKKERILHIDAVFPSPIKSIEVVMKI